jgi:putative redox protein
MSSAHAEKTTTGQLQVRVQTGAHVFLMDEPPSVGGDDSGPNPFDMLCSALAGCMAITIKMYADRKGWTLDRLGVRATHHKDSAEARDRLECTVELGGVTAEQRERMMEIARRCPMHLLLERGADVLAEAAPDDPLDRQVA